jgi:methylglutaconyl-CoA hydratase
MSEPLLLLERRGAIALLTLNRPDRRNALSPDLADALSEAAASLGADASVRAAVLTGAGDCFCAGADLASLKALRQATLQENRSDSARFLRLFRSLATFPKPLVAAVNGPALAGGCGLATCCDVILASPSASFGYPEVRVGFVAAMVLVLLARQLGDRRAREMLLTGTAFSSEEAVSLGLASGIVPSESLVREALSRAEKLAAGAPGALALTKELLWSTSGLSLGAALGLAATSNLFARTSPEMREGLDAFFEKRRPRW